MPLMMMSVPCPSTRGPKTFSVALVIETIATRMRTPHIGPSIPARRRSAPRKSFERSPGTPAEFQRPVGRVSGAERSSSSSNSSSRMVIAASPSCCFALLADLRLHDLGVRGVVAHQLVVTARTDDHTVFEHEDVVGGRDGRHALRHDH